MGCMVTISYSTTRACLYRCARTMLLPNRDWIMNPNPGLYDTKVEAPFTFTLQNTLHAHRHSMPLLSEHGVVMSILVRLLVHEAIAPMALPPTNDDAMRFLTESTTTGHRITNPLVLDALCRLVYDVFMDLHQ